MSIVSTQKSALFSQRIAIVRGERSRKAFAAHIGVAERTLYAWEREESEPKYADIRRIADATNCSILWLMTGDGDPYLESPSSSPSDSALPEYRLRYSHIPYDDDPFRIIDTAGLNLRIEKLAGDDPAGFAEKIGIDLSDLNAYISGEDTPSRDHIRRIAEAGDVEVAYVARGAEVVKENADKKVLAKHRSDTTSEGGVAQEQRVLQAWLHDRDLRAIHKPSEDEIELLRQMRFPGIGIDKPFISDQLVAIRKLEMRSEE